MRRLRGWLAPLRSSGYRSRTVRRAHVLSAFSRLIGALLFATVLSVWSEVPRDEAAISALVISAMIIVDTVWRPLFAPMLSGFTSLAGWTLTLASLSFVAPALWPALVVGVTGLLAAAVMVAPSRQVLGLGTASWSTLAAAAQFQDVPSSNAVLAAMAAVAVPLAAWNLVRSRERDDHGELLSALLDTGAMFSWEVDASDGKVLSIVGNTEPALGYRASELVGKAVGRIVGPEGALRAARAPATGFARNTVTFQNRRGESISFREMNMRVKDRNVVRGVSVDVTELAQAGEAMRQLAEHDGLTGLVNRTRLESDAKAMFADGVRVGMLMIDLDRFKEINDTLGHPTGDKLLVALGARLSESLDEGSVIARMGGDEFAVIIPDVDLQTAQNVADRLHREATTPFALDHLELAVGASIGVSVSPQHGTCYTDLLRTADVAVFQAKKAGGGVRPFSGFPGELSVQRLTMAASLSDAIEADEFVLWFQPQIDLASGRVVAAEGLARWNHPERGILLPGDFLDLIEVGPHYRAFTSSMVRQATAFIGQQRAQGVELNVAVNFSCQSFLDRSTPSVVADALSREDVPPHLLTVEVTETDLLDERGRDAPVFHELRELGVKLSIDDFGTGYSSLSRLRRLNVEEVKIDQEFIQGLESRSEDAMIVSAMVHLARLLDREVVAEGVRTYEQAALLAEMGCQRGQGFFWSPAVAPEHFLKTMFEIDPPLAQAA